ncbi:MAG TPA: diguanylate cyclase [Gemmataceae bacterium]|jgi:diguanylate cyclase (GGDEF)-like protein/PAS domain S-box-containing protein|nr:diguanylate cyclase [Gemmataceae bacterium]
MHRLGLVLRSSLALASLTISILFAALALGLVPDRRGAILEGRKNLCEAVAIECSLGAQRHDTSMIKETIIKVAKRNPDILSAAVRTAGGNLLVEVGDHKNLWGDQPASAQAIDTHMEVPIALGNQAWGNVEIRFRPLSGTGLLGPIRNPVFRLVGFVGLIGLLVYACYLWTIIRRADGKQATVIPRRVQATIDTLAEGVVILDKDQKIALANEAFARITGLSAAELQGRGVSEFSWLKSQAAQDAAEAYPWSQAVTGTTQTGVVMGLQSEDSRARTFAVNSAPILGDDGTPRGALATFDDLTLIEKKNSHLRKLLQKLIKSRTDIRRQNQELKALATRDTLTMCLNRRAFFSHFESHYSGAARYGHPLSCVMVDVDHFKSINDRYGHGVGDQVLQQIAEVLKSMVRKSDLVCRYGGEEFCILLPHVDILEARQAAERFREGIESRPCSNICLTASFGVSSLCLGAEQPRELLDQADKALYAAKRGGRNRVVSWDQILDGLVVEGGPDKRTDPPHDAEPEVPIPFHAVTALVSALAYRHLDTAEHSRRVADLCVATAEGLMSQSELYVLEVAGMLHDIGKLGVPDVILMKPGALTDQEWKVIRTHERIGEEIIKAAFTSPELTAITRNHHAWYGGSPHDANLPTGLDIPLGARILAIADAYDAMISDRVYRKGRNREEAVAELRRCAGKQFDPELVERFVTTLVTRDEHRAPPELFLTKQTALRIGIQIEKLAGALDAQDFPTLTLMAGRLRAMAGEYGITQIAAVAAELEKAALANHDRAELVQLTIDLLELCRSTYRSYLPSLESTNGWHAEPEKRLVPV